MTVDRRQVLATAAGLGLLSADAMAQNRRPILNAMMPAEPATLCYPLSNTRVLQQICGSIHESLLLLDWKFRPQPNLARAFDVSADQLVYRFYLQPNVVWHDGVRFTARDVLFSCNVMLRELNPRSRAALNHVQAIRALDALTVEFRLKEPFNAFLLSLMASSAPMMPAHIYEGTNLRTNPFNMKPIGTGPFKFARWERGQYIQLTRNPSYWRPGEPHLTDIYFRVCPTPEQRMVALETGAVDIAFADDIDTVVQSRLFSNRELIAFSNAYIGTGEITVMEMNQRHWPFSDRRFRAAFMHAIDREFLVKAINFGQGKVAQGPIPSTAPYYDEKALVKYDFNPARACAMFDEMGLRAKKGGVRFRFGLLMIPDGGGAMTRGAQYIKQALAQVGLDADLQSSDWSSFSKRSGDWEFDIDCNDYGEYGDPAIGVSRLFVSSNIRKGVPQTNVQGYVNHQVDDLFSKAAIATTHEEAQRCYSQLQHILSHDVAMVWLYERQPMLFYNRRLRDVITGPNGPCDGFGRARLA